MKTLKSGVRMNRNPRYNSETLQFECFCNYNIAFPTLQKFRKHCQSKAHQLWKEDFKIEDKVEPPQCAVCSDPLFEPRKHAEQCSTRDLLPFFKEKIEKQKEKFTSCKNCSCILYRTTLAAIRSWKGDIYCCSCFNSLFLKKQKDHNTLVKLVLVNLEDGKCPLCGEAILLSYDGTIFEHMNPFLKFSDPSASISKGEEVSKVIQECQEQGVRIVHLFCAQIKTNLENECKQIQSKKRLNLKCLTEETKSEIKKTKIQRYAEHILPHIAKICQTTQEWVRENPTLYHTFSLQEKMKIRSAKRKRQPDL
jgi:hypothetical protein